MAYLHLRQENHQILADLPAYFLYKTAQERIAFRTLIDCSNRFESIQLSRRRMANESGATLRSVDRWKSEWVKNGLIESQKRRTHLKTRSLTNRYALHPSFYNPKVRASLTSIPEFSLVFQMVPVPREIVKPLYGRKFSNIKVLLSNNKIDNEHYVSPIKNNVLLGIKLFNQSTEFQASQTCQVEKQQSSTSSLSGYRFDMTPEEKKAYVLARQVMEDDKKKEQEKNHIKTPSPSEIPEWVRKLSSYEQKEWFKKNMSLDHKQALEKLSRERLESGYVDEFEDWREKERRKDNWKKNRIYN